MKEQLKKADLFGLAIIAATLIAYSVRNVWSWYQTVTIIIGALLVVVSVALKAGDIRTQMGRRSTRFGINSAVSVILFLGILGFINYLGAQHSKRIDMTAEKLESLSDESVQVANQVPQDLHIRAFYQGGEYAPDRDLLQRYSSQNKKISYEFIDPDKQPQLAQQYNVTVYGESPNPMTGENVRSGTLILEMAGKTERIEKQSDALREEDVTNSLMKIVKGQKKTIYFTEGHGEKQITSSDRSGFQAAAKELERVNYVVKTVNLATEQKVPDDATVVIMAGPTIEPVSTELDLLDGYLAKGGAVMLLLDPPPAPGLADFAKKWSIDVGANLVVDASGMGRLFNAGPEYPVVTKYGAHKITEKLKNTMTVFPLVRSVSPAMPPVEGVMTQELLSTGDRSWAKGNLKEGSSLEFNEKTDKKGPISIGVLASKDLQEGKKGRLIIIGDSDFASNSLFNFQNNGTLFRNAVTWLAQDENFISIKPKTPGDRPLTLTEAQGKLVSYVVLLLLPGSILATGISVWMKRRR